MRSVKRLPDRNNYSMFFDIQHIQSSWRVALKWRKISVWWKRKRLQAATKEKLNENFSRIDKIFYFILIFLSFAYEQRVQPFLYQSGQPIEAPTKTKKKKKKDMETDRQNFDVNRISKASLNS